MAATLRRTGNDRMHVETRGMWDDSIGNMGTWEFTPYGSPLNFNGPPDVTQLYTGHDLDRATGQYYAPFRFLDPKIGRWASADPLGMVNGTNTYQYALGNPVLYSDAFGLEVSGSYDLCTGRLRVFDSDSGRTMVIGANSGGNPWGDPVPAGWYDLLDHPNADFFRLEALDGIYGNDRHDPSGRDVLRLHKPGRTVGCIAANSAGEWGPVRDMIRGTTTSTTSVDSKSWGRRIFRVGPTKESINRFGQLRVWDSCKSPPPPYGRYEIAV